MHSMGVTYGYDFHFKFTRSGLASSHYTEIIQLLILLFTVSNDIG